MIKLFVTGDNHFGKKYDRYPSLKDRIIQSRYDALDRMVKHAETENCDFFVITGDLFDKTSVNKSDVVQAVDILSSFNGTVLVLPGNHDFYTGEEKVWTYFDDAVSKSGSDIILLNSCEVFSYDVGEEKVFVYPCPCNMKHSDTNLLNWIKSTEMDDSAYNIGIAHGSIEGLSPDMKNEYFKMGMKELASIPVDCWLIGHTHIQYPANLPDFGSGDVGGSKIFNVGTHEQTDLSNNTRGYGFVITLDKNADECCVAHRFESGRIHYYDLSVQVDNGRNLKEALEETVNFTDSNGIVRLNVSGVVDSEDYSNRTLIYKEVLSGFWFVDSVVDDNLSELISSERIKAEFPEIGFASKFLDGLINEPKEVQMAYELLKECRS